MSCDPWLNRWLPLIRERAESGPVLEIGCGHGDDTETLCTAGLEVHAFDRSALAIGLAKIRVPSARLERRNIREPLPGPAGAFGVIVASLSLHYFAWGETTAIVERIRSALRPGGILLCRLNSTEDHHFGARGHPQIEPDFYLVKGEPKRFFDQAAVESIFSAGWNTLSLEHFATSKYIKTKALWELVAERPERRFAE